MSQIIDQLEKRVTPAMDKKYRPIFEKQARFVGNGTYTMGRNYSKDTYELFLMFVADMENLDYEGKDWETEEETE